MMNQLDEMLLDLLDRELNNPPADWPIDVAVRPPDDSWRSAVNANGRPALNIYMTEVREARDHRNSHAIRRPQAAPFLIDCHYLLSAWIPTADPDFATPTLVENWLLGESIRILVDNAPINATAIYGAAPPLTIDESLHDVDLPTDLLPPEGYANLSDFWTGLGQGNTWHPSAHVRITLPLVRSAVPVGPAVRSVSLSGGASFEATAESDALITIGGTVRSVGSGDAVAGAWVRLELDDGSGSTTTATTDTEGRFTFTYLAEGAYLLHAGTAVSASAPQPVEVPGASSYDVEVP